MTTPILDTSRRARRLRVCQCVDNLLGAGAQHVVRLLATRLHSEACESVVYTFQDGPLRPAIESAGIVVRVFPRRLPKFDPVLAWRLRRALRHDRVDVLHMHLFGATLHGFAAAAGLGVRKVITFHARREDNGLQALGWPSLLAAADGVIAVSADAAAQLVARFSLPAAKIATIRNGIDLNELRRPPDKRDTRARFGLPLGARIVGTIGRLTKDKAHADLLRAFARACREVDDVMLVVVGDGELGPALRSYAAQLGIADRVSFLGERSDGRAILPAFDVFALSSVSEGLPMVLMEAMASGVPLVSTRAGGIPEVVTDGVEALLTPTGSPDLLGRALVRLLKDPELAASLSDRAAHRVSLFTCENMVAAYLAVYDGLLPSSIPADQRMASSSA